MLGNLSERERATLRACPPADEAGSGPYRQPARYESSGGLRWNQGLARSSWPPSGRASLRRRSARRAGRRPGSRLQRSRAAASRQAGQSGQPHREGGEGEDAAPVFVDVLQHHVDPAELDRQSREPSSPEEAPDSACGTRPSAVPGDGRPGWRVRSPPRSHARLSAPYPTSRAPPGGPRGRPRPRCLVSVEAQAADDVRRFVRTSSIGRPKAPDKPTRSPPQKGPPTGHRSPALAECQWRCVRVARHRTLAQDQLQRVLLAD